MHSNDISILMKKIFDEESLTTKQKAVLQASLHLFAEKGYKSTTTADIASLAGVAEGTVYKHFKTKDNILNALLIPFIQKVIPKVSVDFTQEVKEQHFKSLKSLLCYMIGNRLQYAIDNQFVAKIFIQEIFSQPKLAQEIGHMFKNNLIDMLNPVVQHLQASGELIMMPPERFFQHVISTFLGYVIPAILTSQVAQLNVEKITDDAVEFLMNGMHPHTDD